MDAFCILYLKSVQPSWKCDCFFDYITENYVGEEYKATYPISLWARPISDERDIRTTNGPESYHQTLSGQVRSNPNVYLMSLVLLNGQEKVYLMFNDLSKGLVNKQRNADARKDAQVRATWQRYVESPRQDDDLRKLLSALGNRFKGKKL